jgi:hypothetical protein
MNSLLYNRCSNKKYKVVPIMEENVDDLDRRPTGLCMKFRRTMPIIHFEYDINQNIEGSQIVIRKPRPDVIDELDQLERGEYIAK